MWLANGHLQRMVRRGEAPEIETPLAEAWPVYRSACTSGSRRS
jgi:hypothetical protein